MKSRTPKVLHGFAGRSMLGHVLAAAETVRAQRTIVVVGHQRDVVTEHLAEIAPGAEPVVQEHQNGTGHAVRLALQAVPQGDTGTVVVLPSDTPLLSGATLEQLLADHESSDAAATILTSVVDDPT